jgi:hypothetical protein
MHSPAALDPWLSENEALVDESDGRLVEQALTLFDRAGVHVPDRLEKGVDPVARLRLLHARMPSGRTAFYRQLLSIFAEFGDRHSRCILPRPWSNRFAFLPFTVGACFENGGRCLVVTGSALDPLRRGDTLVSWNGRPMGEVLRWFMPYQLGANDEARAAKAVQTLTVRPLALLPPPEGDVELMTAGPNGQQQPIRLEWRVADQRCLEQELAAGGPPADDFEVSPAGFMARGIRAGSRKIGWIKIPSLRTPPEQFVPAFAKALERSPREGLVLDLRGCEEGFIQTGERLLQLFTDKPIETERFQFRVTEWIRHLVRTCPALGGWRESIEKAADLGHTFSIGQPLTKADYVNAFGRGYRGAVVILVDALTYSTAEMFAAGMQDHELGLVLGVAGRTGGGGASPWSQDLVYRLSGDALFQRTPGSASIQMAVQRCLRVGRNSDRLLEGAGVVPDVIHNLTRRDVLDADADIAEHAALLLSRPR